MSNRTQWIVIAVAVLGLAAVLGFAATQLGDELFPVKIGDKARDFRAVTVADAGASAATKGIADYKGDVVLLNIWATWCGPCRQEMPAMQRLYDQLGPKGLKIVAVSVDNPGFERTIREFVAEYRLTFEILHDAPGGIRRIYQTTGVPESFVIGRDGTIRRWKIGEDIWDSPANVAYFERLLAEPAE